MQTGTSRLYFAPTEAKVAETGKYDSKFVVTTSSHIREAIASVHSENTHTSQFCSSKQLKIAASNTSLAANNSIQLNSLISSHIHNFNSKSICAFNQAGSQLLNFASAFDPQIHKSTMADDNTMSPPTSQRVTFQSTPTSSKKNVTEGRERECHAISL